MTQSHNQFDHLGYTRHGSWHSLTISWTTWVIQDMGHDTVSQSVWPPGLYKTWVMTVSQSVGPPGLYKTWVMTESHNQFDHLGYTRVWVMAESHNQFDHLGYTRHGSWHSLTISLTTWVIQDMGHDIVSQSVWPPGLYKTWVMTVSYHNQFDHLGYTRHGSWHSLIISLTTWVIQDMGHDTVSQSVWPPGLYKTWVMTQSHNQLDHLGYTRHGSWHSLTISLTTRVIQDMGHDSLTISWTTWVIQDMGHDSLTISWTTWVKRDMGHDSLTISLTNWVIQDMGHGRVSQSVWPPGLYKTWVMTVSQSVWPLGLYKTWVMTVSQSVWPLGLYKTWVMTSLTISLTTWVIQDMGHDTVSQSVWLTGLYKTWVMAESHNQFDHLGYTRHGSWHSLTISLTTWVIQDMGHDTISQSVGPPGL